MRDIINATIGTDHFLKCSTYALARNGEGLTPCLSITIPDGLLDYWAYIDFKKPNGETFKTPRINVGEGKIIYNIPCSVLDTEGKLEVQVVFQNADNEIWKTYVKEFAVRYSINATDDIPDKQDFITEAQKVIDEAEATAKSIKERADNGEFNGKDGANGKDAITDQTYSPESPNAQSGIAVAEAISTVAQKEWELIEDITLTEAVTEIRIPKDNLRFKELHIESLIIPSDTTITSQKIYVAFTGSQLWVSQANPKSTGKLYFVADLYISPDNKIFCDGNLTANYYTTSSGVSSFKTVSFYFMNDAMNYKYISGTNQDVRVYTSDNEFAAGTKFKVWGR